MADADIERMIALFEAVIAGAEDYPLRLIGLAQVLANKKQPFRAFELCRKALHLAAGNPEVLVRARRLLSSLIPRYHVPLMNDARRNVAWSKAFGRAIRSGMHALEIGTGGGMLALMAARAGAEKVTTCERDPILACLAREIAERNGFGDRIAVIAKPSTELLLGDDLEAPADLLFCDIFGDSLFNFDPLTVLADARRRLTKPGAIVVPAAGEIRLALANWERYTTYAHIDQIAGFDLTPFADFAPAVITIPIGDTCLKLKSGPVAALRFDFASLSHPAEGRMEVSLIAAEDARINGILHWIRLELDAETVLEARPEANAVFLSSPRFWPLRCPLSIRRGEKMDVAVARDGRQLTVCPIQSR